MNNNKSNNIVSGRVISEGGASIVGGIIGDKSTFNNNSNSPMEPTGEWINQYTGEVVKIKTMVNDMSNNGSQVLLMDGRLLSFSEFSNNYIQADENYINELEEHNKSNDNNLINQNKVNNLNKDILLAGLIDTKSENKTVEKNSIAQDSKSDDNLNKKLNLNYNNAYSESELIIENFLDKLEKTPEIKFENFDIVNLPTEPLQTFIKYLGVSENDIVEVLYKKLFNENKIKEILKKYIHNINL